MKVMKDALQLIVGLDLSLLKIASRYRFANPCEIMKIVLDNLKEN